MKKTILFLFILFLFTTHSYSRQTSHNFPVGIFKVTDEAVGFIPGTQSFNDALSDLKNGTSNSYEGVNLIQAYRYADDNNSTANSLWQNILSQAKLEGLKVLVDVRFEVIAGSNLIIDGTELTKFREDVQWILGHTETEAIGGWYLSDEPENKGIAASELNKLYTELKAVVPNGINEDVFISQGAAFANQATIKPNNDYGEYSNSWDVLIVNYYNYSANFEDDDIEVYSNVWYPETNPFNSNIISHGSLRAWSYISQKLRDDLQGFPGNLSNKKVFANLVLGEEIPVQSSVISGSNRYNTYNADFLASHEITHAAIKKVYELGFDGIFFYDYISSYPYPSGSPEYREDAKGHWLVNENYAEAVETEIHDRDWLVTALSNSSGSDNRTYLSNRGSSFLNTASGPCYNVTGQCPTSGYHKPTGGTVVTHLSTGDLWGEESSDYTYVINTNQDRKSIADGDDELVWATEDRDFWISEDDHVNSYFDNQLNSFQNLNSDQNANSNEEITALATGDFDGDGDFEVVTAIYKIYYIGSTPYHTSSIYVSNEGQNFKQGSPIYSYAGNLYTGNVPKITALVAGDFDGSGRDKLVTATWNSGFSDLYIYLSDIAKGESPVLSSNALTINTNSSTYVYALAKGDFDGDFKDDLATVARHKASNWNVLSISKPKVGGGTGNPLHSDNHVWDSSIEQLTAITAGDFYGERRDYLITGFWNSSTNRSNIYQSRPSFDSDGYGEGDPTITSNSETTHIYANGTYWHPTAMTVASFRESGTGLSSKVNPGNPDLTVEVPTEVTLSQNYPNPFNPVTTINYTIKDRSEVSIDVYNLLGRKVASLVNGVKEPGTYSVNFDASNLSSGIYIYELRSGTTVLKEKMTLIK
ncbi:MAG: T9SS C-terminal target domain-containing protein [Balneola sp.]|nr:MAG: T9SS C-terminal target domain-containing protein [Balneola sp.]